MGIATILQYIYTLANDMNNNRLGRNASDTGRHFITRINDLLPQSAYVFRCKAESAVGESAAFSGWVSKIDFLHCSYSVLLRSGDCGGSHNKE